MSNILKAIGLTPGPGGPTWISLALPVLRPMVMTYLVHNPGTREWRLIFWATSMAMLVWDMLAGALSENTIWLAVFGAVGPGTIWAWAEDPTYVGPSTRPYFFSNRDWTLWKAFDLGINYRLIGIRNPVPNPKRGYIWSLIRHAWYAVFTAVTNDIVTFHTFRTIMQYPLGTSHKEIRQSLSATYGYPPFLVDAWFSVVYALETYLGLLGTFHGVAFVAIASGLWVDSEWPDLTDKPWLSTSLSELWGKRYHQLLREALLAWTTPVRAYLPRILHIPVIFLFSGLIYAATWSTILHVPVYHRFLPMLLIAGAGCGLERLYHRFTGGRVGGVLGWIWTWSWMLFLILPQVIPIWWDKGAEIFFKQRWHVQIGNSAVPTLQQAFRL